MDFLLERSTLFGVEFQNWMPILVGVYVIYFVYIWMTRDRRRRTARMARTTAAAKPNGRSNDKLSEEQLQALRLLAGAGPQGVTGTLMVMHGLSSHQLFDMERDGLIAAGVESMPAAERQATEVRWFRITPAGLTALHPE